MRQSQLFTKTKKKTSKDVVAVSHQYLIRGDFIEQTISGVYRFLPLGFLVFKKIEKIIREEMLNLGAQEVYLPALQDKKLWLETGRWNTIDPPLFKFKDRHKKELALGPTHEEEIVDIVRKRVKSYQDLPFSLFQIQNKFRNEMRATGGLLRTREFVMKDLYSFHTGKKDLVNFYNKVRKTYSKIYKRCGLKTVCVEASSGTIGGKLSHEFMALSERGEDKILICKKCGYGANVEIIGKAKKCPQCKAFLEEKTAIEVGHVFYLGTKYSKAMKANYRDKDGKAKLISMGCYGIGLPRLMATIVEIYHDEKGIIWPQGVAPFQVHLIALENVAKVRKVAEKLYRDLQRIGFKVLYDDRKEKTAGEKFADCDLIGVPTRLVVSEKTLKKDCVELKKRKGKRIKLIKINQLSRFLKSH
ncbi:MAG: proline--tRNA ligase [Candidatus Paceibacterales bacterium]